MDIWVNDEDTVTTVELEYKTRSVDISIGDGWFALQNQAAQDLVRYDSVKDIERLVRVVAAGRQVVAMQSFSRTTLPTGASLAKTTP